MLKTLNLISMKNVLPRLLSQMINLVYDLHPIGPYTFYLTHSWKNPMSHHLGI